MTFGSLFAGIGGFDLGLERAGMTCAWQVEREPYAVRVLEKHWPNVRRHDDVCTFPPEEGDWDVDLICGGFPCQDISFAGKGAGLAGARSGLWHEMHRIIGELRPRHVIVENVAALLSRGMETVLGELSEIGYDAEWHVIPAAAVGAPHRRDRVWIVAIDADCLHEHQKCTISQEQCADASRACEAVPDADSSDVAHSESVGNTEQRPPHCGANSTGASRAECTDISSSDVGNADSVLLERHREAWQQESCSRRQEWQPQRPSCDISQWWATEPDVGRVAHGVSSRVDRLRCLGNAVVPQVVELIGRAIIESTGGPAGGRE